MAEKQYVVSQTPDRESAWRHYFCGWFGGVPHWSSDRQEALKVDEQAARQLVERFDDRYRRVVHHHIEEIRD